jgi:hypothetical protein
MNTFIEQTVNKLGVTLLSAHEVLTVAINEPQTNLTPWGVNCCTTFFARVASVTARRKPFVRLEHFHPRQRSQFGSRQKTEPIQVQYDHARKIHGCGRSSCN